MRSRARARALERGERTLREASSVCAACNSCEREATSERSSRNSSSKAASISSDCAFKS
jgi:hypothetical protein